MTRSLPSWKTPAGKTLPSVRPQTTDSGRTFYEREREKDEVRLTIEKQNNRMNDIRQFEVEYVVLLG